MPRQTTFLHVAEFADGVDTALSRTCGGAMSCSASVSSADEHHQPSRGPVLRHHQNCGYQEAREPVQEALASTRRRNRRHVRDSPRARVRLLLGVTPASDKPALAPRMAQTRLFSSSATKLVRISVVVCDFSPLPPTPKWTLPDNV